MKAANHSVFNSYLPKIHKGYKLFLCLTTCNRA